MVGLLEDISSRMTLNFKGEGDLLYVLGNITNDIHSSEYLYQVLGVKYSPAPHFELEEEYALQQKLSELISAQLVRSAHDVAEGGLFVSLCESAFTDGLGFSVASKDGIRKDAFYFGEGQSRVVVSVALDKVAAFEKALNGFPAEKIGVVTSGDVVVDGEFWGNIESWQDRYDNAIGNQLAKEEAGSALSSI
jgi:phosphoribosylformylglycinamidine synthase